MAYEEDIPKELIAGEVYTSEKITNYISFNNNAVVLCDETAHFQIVSGISYRVKSKFETYVHKNENQTYHIPSSKKTVYYVERV